MSEEFVRIFSNISKEDVGLAGGKGASLGEMIQHDIPVPNGFVILSTAFERFINETKLNVEIDSILHKVNHKEMHTVEEASEEIQALILQQEFPQDLSKIILQEFEKLQTRFVAVRSSATAEDSNTAAWAGQLDTFLNTNKETLLENVKKCWASLFTPRAIFYRFEKELHKTKISVAVVVQKMVESEISGIAFSVHPVTEDYNQLIIEAGYGLGEAIVSGQITPDSFVVEKEPFHILNKQINKQAKQLVRKEQGGNEWKEIEEEEGKQQVLSNEQILELSKLIIQIEKHYGFPVDVEWALEKGNFYITQSRPITTLTQDVKKKVEIISTLEKYSFERYERGPVQPLISYEYAFRSFVDNPFIEKQPNLVILQHDNYEAWEEKSSKPVVSDDTKIREIIDFSLSKIEEYENPVKNFLDKKDLNREQAIEGLNLLNNICLELYKGYVFFCVEYFNTKEEELLKNIPEVRMKLSEFITKVWESYNKVLFFCEKEFGLKKASGDMCSSEEILNLLEGDKQLLSIQNLDKRAIVFTILNGTFEVYLDKDAEAIEEHLIAQNPLLKNIEFAKKEGVLKGNSAYQGKVIGEVIKITEKEYDKYEEVFGNKTDYILVAPMTRPEIVPFIKKAKGIITDEGGISCHAAIAARELKVPCVIGTKIATQVLKDGMEVEVDADNGVVKIIQHRHFK
jgi:phosphoenolpyruvate synthase/pyruvate phosphate dikinase